MNERKLQGVKKRYIGFMSNCCSCRLVNDFFKMQIFGLRFVGFFGVWEDEKCFCESQKISVRRRQFQRNDFVIRRVMERSVCYELWIFEDRVVMFVSKGNYGGLSEVFIYFFVFFSESLRQ